MERLRGSTSAEVDAPSGEGREAAPGGPQRLPDLVGHNSTEYAAVYPTESKAGEHERQTALNAEGKERVVKKRVVKVEENGDDYGEDPSSLTGPDEGQQAWFAALGLDLQPWCPTCITPVGLMAWSSSCCMGLSLRQTCERCTLCNFIACVSSRIYTCRQALASR